MLMALFQNKESLSSNKTTRVCGQADKNVQLQARPRGLIGVRRDFNLLLHPIVIRRLTIEPYPFGSLINIILLKNGRKNSALIDFVRSKRYNMCVELFLYAPFGVCDRPW